MEEAVAVGLDIAKSVFQVHGVDAERDQGAAAPDKLGKGDEGVMCTGSGRI